jgi:hypothetical protein
MPLQCIGKNNAQQQASCHYLVEPALCSPRVDKVGSPCQPINQGDRGECGTAAKSEAIRLQQRKLSTVHACPNSLGIYEILDDIHFLTGS